ncbi:MAG: hypothetical protein HY918_05945 [Candidatus Doudnabacteria bacterium]|nr:hypothetical protein [Candidatus Doudnabacteria bacterium]
MPEQNLNTNTNSQLDNSPEMAVPTPTPNASSPTPAPSAAKKVWKIVGAVIGAVVIIFILLAWYGYYLEKQQPNSNSQTSNSSQNNMNNKSNEFKESQLEQMLMPKGSSQQELADQQAAIEQIFKHPEQVNPFMYAELAGVLAKQGNIEQAAFWFYIFQSRSGAWVANDPDQSNYPALKASLNQVIGGPINEWAGSDVNAWHDLAAKSISYEKKFPFYSGKIDGISDAEWQTALQDGRKKFESGFNEAFQEILSDGGKSNEEQRKANGLYVGPWQSPGKPLLAEWK